MDELACPKYMKNFELISFATADELAHTAAGAWLDEIETTSRAGKAYSVALSGGRITQKFFASIVEQARPRATSFARVHFFWADERCVPPGDPESNFKMASDLLFSPLKIPANQIHRLRGEDLPDAAVKTAESELRQIAPSNQDGQPVLDLIFLGMGEDGHVASLFPGAPAEIVQCSAPFLAVDNSPKPPPRRISLSFAAIAAAKQVWVLISGAGKEKALQESLDFSGKTPLGRVIQLRQNTRIFSEIRPKLS
jgi:6-phosphogluconolactonase